jgi:hypothetical protein
MTYERFEDLPVWQEAAELYDKTEELLVDRAFKATSGFREKAARGSGAAGRTPGKIPKSRASVV